MVNEIRLYVRDAGILERHNAMTALERIQRDQLLQEAVQLIPTITPTRQGLIVMLLVIFKLAAYAVHQLPRW